MSTTIKVLAVGAAVTYCEVRVRHLIAASDRRKTDAFKRALRDGLNHHTSSQFAKQFFDNRSQVDQIGGALPSQYGGFKVSPIVPATEPEHLSPTEDVVNDRLSPVAVDSHQVSPSSSDSSSSKAATRCGVVAPAAPGGACADGWRQ